MFLRLRYYFKTDRKIRVQDKQEYADQRKKLKNLDDMLSTVGGDVLNVLRPGQNTIVLGLILMFLVNMNAVVNEGLIIVNLLRRDKNILAKSNLFMIFGAIVCANV